MVHVHKNNALCFSDSSDSWDMALLLSHQPWAMLIAGSRVSAWVRVGRNTAQTPCRGPPLGGFSWFPDNSPTPPSNYTLICNSVLKIVRPAHISASVWLSSPQCKWLLNQRNRDGILSHLSSLSWLAQAGWRRIATREREREREGFTIGGSSFCFVF